MVTENNSLIFTDNIASALKGELEMASFSTLFVIVDENTETHCLPIIANSLPEAFELIRIKSGEANKTLATCEQIWNSLTDVNSDRQTLIINLGGGVICDMGGFCARTYKRGVSFWNIPTTLLSQVDASVGGKLGIDFGVYKNQIGLFSEPDRVLIDDVFFETLPKAEMLSGFAEMVKHALILDKLMFEALIEEKIQDIDWRSWVRKSVGIKQAIVAQDPRENGLRKALNFGHTIGHAIESHYLRTSKPLKHGEAVAIGMIAETYISTAKAALSRAEGDRINEYLLAVFSHRKINEDGIKSILKLVLQDKKNDNKKIKAVLLNKIGEAVIDVEISELDIRESLNQYNQLIK